MLKYSARVVVCSMASFWPWLASDLFAEVEVINGDFSEPGFVVDEQFSDFTHDIPWWGELNTNLR